MRDHDPVPFGQRVDALARGFDDADDLVAQHGSDLHGAVADFEQVRAAEATATETQQDFSGTRYRPSAVIETQPAIPCVCENACSFSFHPLGHLPT